MSTYPSQLVLGQAFVIACDIVGGKSISETSNAVPTLAQAYLGLLQMVRDRAFLDSRLAMLPAGTAEFAGHPLKIG